MLVNIWDERRNMHRLDLAEYKPDVEPRELAIYTPADAAAFLGIHPSTLSTWIHGRNYPTKNGARYFEPLITLADPKNRLLSFYNLAEAHILSATRYEHKISLKAIRAALHTLSERYGSTHPLLAEELATNGIDLFVHTIEETENLRTGQFGLKPIIDLFLKRIVRDDKLRMPQKIYPVVRGQLKNRHVAVIHGVSSGRPIIDGTSVPVWVVVERKKSGESPKSIAQDFGIDLRKVIGALEYAERRAA